MDGWIRNLALSLTGSKTEIRAASLRPKEVWARRYTATGLMMMAFFFIACLVALAFTDLSGSVEGSGAA
jgi:hypothetical protein